jgi:hypothetical protein
VFLKHGHASEIVWAKIEKTGYVLSPP